MEVPSLPLIAGILSLLTGLYDPRAFITHAASLHRAFAHCARFPNANSRRSLDHVSVPVWPAALSGRLSIVALVSRYLTNKLMARGPISARPKPLMGEACVSPIPSGISSSFPLLSQTPRHVTHVLLTRSPLGCIGSLAPEGAAEIDASPFDSHLLGTPPAFVLSQDQTRRYNATTQTRALCPEPG